MEQKQQVKEPDEHSDKEDDFFADLRNGLGAAGSVEKDFDFSLSNEENKSGEPKHEDNKSQSLSHENDLNKAVVEAIEIDGDAAEGGNDDMNFAKELEGEEQKSGPQKGHKKTVESSRENELDKAVVIADGEDEESKHHNTGHNHRDSEPVELNFAKELESVENRKAEVGVLDEHRPKPEIKLPEKLILPDTLKEKLPEKPASPQGTDVMIMPKSEDGDENNKGDKSATKYEKEPAGEIAQERVDIRCCDGCSVL